MKRHGLLVGLALAAGAGWLRADDDRFAAPSPPADRVTPVDVLVQVAVIEVAHGTVTQLLEDPVRSRDGTALRVRAQELVRAGDARIRHTMLLRTTAGGKAVSVSARELIYPTEYEPPELPSGMGRLQPNPGGKPILRTPDQPDTPTAFETRDLGEVCSAEAVLGETPGSLQLVLELELARCPELVAWMRRRTPGGNEFVTSMPEIETLRLAPRIEVPDGSHALAAVLAGGGAGQRLLVFVRCDVLEPDAG